MIADLVQGIVRGLLDGLAYVLFTLFAGWLVQPELAELLEVLP